MVRRLGEDRAELLAFSGEEELHFARFLGALSFRVPAFRAQIGSRHHFGNSVWYTQVLPVNAQRLQWVVTRAAAPVDACRRVPIGVASAEVEVEAAVRRSQQDSGRSRGDGDTGGRGL